VESRVQLGSEGIGTHSLAPWCSKSIMIVVLSRSSGQKQWEKYMWSCLLGTFLLQLWISW